MNLNDVEKEIVNAFLTGKEIELYNAWRSIWDTEKKLHEVLFAVASGCNWRVKKNIKIVEYGVYLNRFRLEPNKIDPILWVSDGNTILPTYTHVENMPSFIRWITKGTYDIEVG